MTPNYAFLKIHDFGHFYIVFNLQNVTATLTLANFVINSNLIFCCICIAYFCSSTHDSSLSNQTDCGWRKSYVVIKHLLLFPGSGLKRVSLGAEQFENFAFQTNTDIAEKKQERHFCFRLRLRKASEKETEERGWRIWEEKSTHSTIQKHADKSQRFLEALQLH